MLSRSDDVVGRLFQSLLYWNEGCNMEIDGKTILTSCGFNPCCIGMRVATDQVLYCYQLPIACFNPCCIGMRVATFIGIQFQSLLYWNEGCNMFKGCDDAPDQHPGFNPCCIGMRIATL